jgi:hypothetical protein
MEGREAMTLGEFRERTKELPDAMRICIQAIYHCVSEGGGYENVSEWAVEEIAIGKIPGIPYSGFCSTDEILPDVITLVGGEYFGG